MECVLCLLSVKDLGVPGNNKQMMVEKGEDVKQSADQSSPDSKKVCNWDSQTHHSMRLHFFQITGFLPGHLKLFGKLRK